jgi:hypothetical protein
MTTVKPKQEPEISIPSNDPKSDVWNFISYFESEYFVRRFIEKRIRRKIHYRNVSILKKLKKNNSVITYDPKEKDKSIPGFLGFSTPRMIPLLLKNTNNIK